MGMMGPCGAKKMPFHNVFSQRNIEVLHCIIFLFLRSIRYRKMKERLGLTEIRKHANRMTFAEVS